MNGMREAADQIFVNAKQWLVEWMPPALQPLSSILLSVSAIVSVFALLFAITTIVERKGLGRFQNRLGPNRVGPFGWLQPVADGLKTLTKEDVVPRAADRVVHFLAPLALVVPVFLAFSVLPIGRNMAAIDLDAGLLFFFAVGASSELAVFMAGWSSRNKYSLLGAMRAIAQMISYEVPLIVSSLTVVMMAGTLSLVEIVRVQADFWHGLPQWHVLTPWGLAGFLLFFVAATAESNRSPFDLPEGESEIIAGYYLEYSGFKFALFFLGEYLGLFAVSSLAVTLFLGGWSAPVSLLAWLPSWFWFFAKLCALIAVLIWVRATVPRLRMDQLMRFAWTFMLPMALINLVVAAVWHYVGGGLAGWLIGAVLLAAPYVGLGLLLSRPGGFRKRTYRFAD
jgi:NADH-quinone oxidoreductase subunit H